MEGIAPILGRTMVLVAHPDDEVIGCGALLQRMRQASVVFCTDGAPFDDFFWRRYGSREAYAQLRQQEARRALECTSGRAEPIFLADRVPELVDQQLFRFLPQGFDALVRVVQERRPDALLTLAYEGGHPDHDSCCFLAAQLARELAVPAWEFPLYHRSTDGLGVKQEFAQPGDQEFVLHATAGEQEVKKQMLAAYASQGDILAHFGVELERVRPLAGYDFSRPPLPGVLNYEAWQWQITGAEVAASFARFLVEQSTPDVAGQVR
ncbi:MAG: PIG-L family deacetylase [Acidobacteria bacterium]|nr:PIG-L family deacetylase [Acidobacteriota bacterium]